jgi:stage V sporulation protein AD
LENTTVSSAVFFLPLGKSYEKTRGGQVSTKHTGKQTVFLQKPPSVTGAASVVGKMEGKGPLAKYFDYIGEDTYFGEKTWEKAESNMLKKCFGIACDKAKTPPSDIEYMFTGDLLNQCTGSTFAMRDAGVPYFGLYGACSTMAESLALAAMTIDGGFADTAAALTSSHFCSAERQFRYQLEYGGQRTPTSQWTVTGAGAVILKSEGPGPYVTAVTAGKIVDAGIKDITNMGAAMAPAAYDTITTHLSDTGRELSYYDAIVTGDLGRIGHDILCDMLIGAGYDLIPFFTDCGVLIYDFESEDVHAGGSGCGCSASVLAGYLIPGMRAGRFKKLLFAATGALMSTVTTQQGESIPSVCHAVALEAQMPSGS